METSSNCYQRGLELAEAGKYQEALGYIQEHLRTVPDDAQALNDTGTILHCMGRSDEAITHFIKARSLQSGSPEITWNLAEAYLAAGRADRAQQLFGDMERMGILSADVLNRTANVFLNQNNKADTVEMLLRSLQISPEQEILKPMIEVIRSKRPRIAFFCGADGQSLPGEIAEFIKQRFETQFFKGQTEEEIYELMKNSDIAWFEWCAEAAEVLRLPKVCKNIVSIDCLESHHDQLSRLQWENVDALITIGNSSVRDTMLEQVPDIENRTRLVTVPSAVNLDKFKFIDRRRGKNLACTDHLNVRKNPMFLIQCMQKLHYIDPEYKLFLAGTSQDRTLEQYIRHMVRELDLADVVFFDGRQEDVNSWLQDKHYIVSCSIEETRCTGLLEVMACGLKPVVHNSPGTSQIFPSQFLFDIAEDFCEQICSDAYQPQDYRRFVEENYSLKNQLSKINEVLIQLEIEIDSSAIAAEQVPAVMRD